MNKTFAELALDPVSTIYEDYYEDGLRVLILRGPCSLCAYVGIPSGHPLAGHDYNDLPVGCHGGLTFGQEGDDKPWPKGFYWYGWDYAHVLEYKDLDQGVIEWTIEVVNNDIWSALYDFKHLLKLSEGIRQRV